MDCINLNRSVHLLLSFVIAKFPGCAGRLLVGSLTLGQLSNGAAPAGGGNGGNNGNGRACPASQQLTYLVPPKKAEGANGGDGGGGGGGGNSEEEKRSVDERVQDALRDAQVKLLKVRRQASASWAAGGWTGLKPAWQHLFV
jgi:hypothetical protein